MKAILSLLFLQVALVTYATQKTIPRTPDGGWYFPNVSHINPGDSVIVTGNYNYAYLKGLRGTAENKITIIANTDARFGTDGNYALIMDSCAHIIIEGRNFAGIPYSLKFGKASGTYSPQTLTPFNSTNIEIRYVEVTHGEVGIFANPNIGSDMDSMYFHHNYIHDLRGIGSSEAFYIGNTGKFDTTSPRFTHLRITNNIIENVGGDGIQVCCAPGFLVDSNRVFTFGVQLFGNHSAGILIGGNSWGTVSNNHVANGLGSGLQVLGYGTSIVKHNAFLNTATNINQQPDAIYISKRGGFGSALLQVNIYHNIISGAARFGINNDGTQTTGGIWKCNTVIGAALAPYRTSGDIIDESCIWECNCVQPLNK